MENPLLRRDLQLIPARVQGRRLIAFLDPLKLVAGDLALDMELYAVIELLDGRHSIQDIQLSLVKKFGGMQVGTDDLESFLEDLDRYYLLESDRFKAEKDRIYREFGAACDRRPVHAGKAYAGEASALASFISEVEEKLPPLSEDVSGSNIVGILAPHIDIGAAKSTYVDLYRRLQGKRYERAIILGINHQMQDGLYCLCEKRFITPFGRIDPDISFINELKKRLPSGTLSSDDFGHKMEHSIEFQTVFLHHYLANPFKIVPVLCGGIHEFLFEGKNLFEDRGFQKTVQTLTDMIGEEDGRTLVVAAVDFSHVGLKFGHQSAADTLLPKAMENDREIISFIEHGKAEALFENARATKDCFNVCGFPSIILFTALMRQCSGRRLDHRIYREEATASAVTYASMIFTGSDCVTAEKSRVQE